MMFLLVFISVLTTGHGMMLIDRFARVIGYRFSYCLIRDCNLSVLFLNSPGCICIRAKFVDFDLDIVLML